MRVIQPSFLIAIIYNNLQLDSRLIVAHIEHILAVIFYILISISMFVVYSTNLFAL